MNKETSRSFMEATQTFESSTIVLSECGVSSLAEVADNSRDQNKGLFLTRGEY